MGAACRRQLAAAVTLSRVIDAGVGAVPLRHARALGAGPRQLRGHDHVLPGPTRGRATGSPKAGASTHARLTAETQRMLTGDRPHGRAAWSSGPPVRLGLVGGTSQVWRTQREGDRNVFGR